MGIILYKMKVLDITHFQPKESAAFIDKWICDILDNETCGDLV